MASAGLLLAFVAASCVIPQAAESPTPPPLASASPLPSPSGAAAVTGANADPVVAVVQDLLPSVVTVINKLSNGQPQSSGSGFIVDASRGYIVTNNHVVEDVNFIRITRTDGPNLFLFKHDIKYLYEPD